VRTARVVGKWVRYSNAMRFIVKMYVIHAGTYVKLNVKVILVDL